MRLALKGCGRCGGDLLWEQDGFGAFRTCVQCGAVLYPPKTQLVTNELLRLPVPYVARPHRRGTTRGAQRLRPWRRNGQQQAQHMRLAWQILPRRTL